MYVNDFDYAREHGEIELYYESRKINNECARAIDEAISKHSTFTEHGGGRYVDCEKALNDVVEQYGAQRVNAVVAHSVNKHEWDGRLSQANKDWAKTIEKPKIDYIPLDTHLTILDGFADKVRNAHMALENSASKANTAESIRIDVSPEMREVLTGLSDAMKEEELELDMWFVATELSDEMKEEELDLDMLTKLEDEINREEKIEEEFYRDCATAIDEAIKTNTKPEEKIAALKAVMEEYGMYVDDVLQVNIKYRIADRKITAINRKWAENRLTPDISIPRLQCSTLDLNNIVKYVRETGPFDYSDDLYRDYRDCARAIDEAIKTNTKPGKIAGRQCISTTVALKTVTEEYGVQCVNDVLAANIKYHESDKKITAINKKWAEDIETPDNIPHLQCHTSILNNIAKNAREAEQQTEQARETEDSEDMER